VSILTHCRRCGVEFEANRRAIVGGAWRLCPACRDPEPSAPPSPPTDRCAACGRPLRAGKRTICARCFGVAA